MGEEELHELIKGCVKQDRKCQKMLYKAFYGFAMGICLRYTNDRDEASGVLNQGFFKVFTHIDSFDTARPFKAWLGRIMMNYNDLLVMVQQLPPAYRTVFNLFAIEGYSHEEIAVMLNINAGTSKSNLHKARLKLKKMILEADLPDQNTNYNTRTDYIPIVAINAINIQGVFLNRGIRG